MQSVFPTAVVSLTRAQETAAILIVLESLLSWGDSDVDAMWGSICSTNVALLHNMFVVIVLSHCVDVPELFIISLYTACSV